MDCRRANRLASRRLLSGLIPEVCLGMTGSTEGVALVGPEVRWLSGREESMSGCLTLNSSKLREGEEVSGGCFESLRMGCWGWKGMAEDAGVNLFSWVWVGWMFCSWRMFLVAVL